MSVEMPAFPNPVNYRLNNKTLNFVGRNCDMHQALFYERSARLAWETRARFLIAAMIQAPKEATREHCEETLAEALSAVGELPPEAGT